jgi:hypothetical protein
MPALFMASFIATAASFAAWLSFKVPPKAPIAVRHAETITTSFMMAPSSKKQEMNDHSVS